MYRVIKEFAGIKVGTERNFNEAGAKLLIKKGLIEKVKAVKEVPQNKAIETAPENKKRGRKPKAK